MYFEFANVLVFLLVACGFILGSMVAGRIIRRHRPDPEKLTTYECGEDTIGTAWVQFNVRFYIVALIFLVFDVESPSFFPGRPSSPRRRPWARSPSSRWRSSSSSCSSASPTCG